jgi:hypothetical protein
MHKHPSPTSQVPWYIRLMSHMPPLTQSSHAGVVVSLSPKAAAAHRIANDIGVVIKGCPAGSSVIQTCDPCEVPPPPNALAHQLFSNMSSREPMPPPPPPPPSLFPSSASNAPPATPALALHHPVPPAQPAQPRISRLPKLALLARQVHSHASCIAPQTTTGVYY